MIAFRILFLIGMIRLLIATNKPGLCAAIYSAFAVVSTLFFSGSLPSALIAGGISFVLSGIYFSLLKRFDDGLLWWFILVSGFLLGFF